MSTSIAESSMKAVSPLSGTASWARTGPVLARTAARPVDSRTGIIVSLPFCEYHNRQVSGGETPVPPERALQHREARSGRKADGTPRAGPRQQPREREARSEA